MTDFLSGLDPGTNDADERHFIDAGNEVCFQRIEIDIRADSIDLDRPQFAAS
jgi:hypothetical protein